MFDQFAAPRHGYLEMRHAGDPNQDDAIANVALNDGSVEAIQGIVY